MSDYDELMVKAERAFQSAKLLHATGDLDGATNRAYYAIFDAARAALLTVNAPIAATKSHSGIISAFGMHFVKTGILDISLGRAFNRAEDLRLLADYADEPVAAQHVQDLMENAERFVAAIRALRA